jgi:hypothetical protein
LIDEFWEKQNKEKKGKPKSTKSAGRTRKSITRDDSPDASESLPSNKRKKSISGRKSKSSQPDGHEDEEEEKPPPKKAKKASRANGASEDIMDVDERDDAESQYRPMQKFKDKKSWETLVQRVDTIEKVEGTLKVFFTL